MNRFNRSLDADTRLKAAASRRMSRAGQLQRYAPLDLVPDWLLSLKKWPCSSYSR
jgi:hypothetical protein